MVDQQMPAHDPAAIAAEIDKLALLAPIEYDRERQTAADRLGIRVPTLDREVEKRRAALGMSRNTERTQGRSIRLPTPEPHPHPVDGASLLDELEASVRRHLALPEECAKAIALWVVFAHALDAFETSPRLAFVSPEKRCGKTTALRLLQRLVPKPLSASNASGAALFRMIEKECPTLLIDEADTFLDEAEAVRNVLNSGHTRDTAFTLRTVGEEHEARLFSTWCAVAIAKIGKLPSTLEDRSIVVCMRRKLPGERVERLHAGRVGQFELFASKAARWASDNRERLVSADPMMPEGLNDRAADNWGPLLAIADAAGGHWPEVARHVAIQLSGTDESEADSTRVQLLADIRETFEETARERLATQEIISQLVAREDWPWGEAHNGKPITPALLAKMLRQFHIRPKPYRAGAGTLRGYSRSDFEDAWQRYLPPETTKQPLKLKDLHNPDPATVESAVACGGSAKSLQQQDCYAVSGRVTTDDDQAEERAAIIECDGKPSRLSALGSPAATAADPLDIPPFLRRSRRVNDKP
jgi:hypothetical protein